jgi:type II secretory ATPase GspE/PulE/Tfp pilus assembly ATPase PilB-like protein
MRHGLHTLRDDGWRKVLDGVTTVEEILRVSEEDEE